jgi:hypothetical protein
MGPLLELAVVKEYLPYIKPKTILWGYFEKNDLIDLGNEKTNRLLMKYLEDGFTQDLFHRQAEIDRALVDLVESGMAKQRKQEALQRKRENELFSHLDKFLEILKLGALRARLELIYGIEGNQKSREMPMTNLTLLRRILKQAKTAVSRWGGQIYFVYLPAWERYAESKIAPRDRDAVIELVRELGLPLIDLHPVFRTHRDPLSLFPFRGFGHYNEAGNLVVANTILRFISASGELSRSM